VSSTSRSRNDGRLRRRDNAGGPRGSEEDGLQLGHQSADSREAGAELDAEAAAAKAAASTTSTCRSTTRPRIQPSVDSFLTVITDKANEPAFIHCASANRAAMMWMVKRIAVDKWDVEKASEEATALGLTNPALKTSRFEQAKKH